MKTQVNGHFMNYKGSGRNSGVFTRHLLISTKLKVCLMSVGNGSYGEEEGKLAAYNWGGGKVRRGGCFRG